MQKTVLILGGTGEARRLADQLVDELGDQLRIVTSLAGRTKSPKLPKGEVREGGFGGTDGLVSYLRDTQVDVLIDATHPYAAQITDHATEAANKIGIPLVVLSRPAWKPEPEDNWIIVPDMGTAADAISGKFKSVLITTGVQNLAAFADIEGTKLLVRLIEQPETEIPIEAAHILYGKPPYKLDDELALYKLLGIDAIVTKNAGGNATFAKIDAARTLGLSVIMIDRPPTPTGLSKDQIVEDIDQAMAGIKFRLGIS